MAIAATANLVLVVFDLTYVSWRNFWLQGNIPIPFTAIKFQVPLPVINCSDRSVERGAIPRPLRQSAITCFYDPVKGIEPNRDTRAYLDWVNHLEQQVAQKGLDVGLNSPEVQETLKMLQGLSAEMIGANPFAAADKTGTLEKIKNEIRRHVSQRTNVSVSSKEAFEIFWSTNHPKYPNYLASNRWKSEIDWLNSTIKPLFETNFYRKTGENGEPINHFWILDAPFVILFLLEFLARTFYNSRRYISLNWLDAIIWRWYDIPLFIPFSLFMPFLALSRVMPTLLRLHQAEIIDLEEIYHRGRQGFVAAIAEEITEVVIVQIINQIQGFVRKGELTDLLERTTSRRYVDLNNINEIEAIAKHFTQLLIYQVFPKVQPDLEALLGQTIDSVLSQSPAYRGIQALPGIGNVPSQITQRLVSEITQTSYSSLKAILEDPKTVELITRLVQNFGNTLVSEAQGQQNFQEVQLLLTDLLEEIKINYIQRLPEEDITVLLDQTRQIQRSRT